VLRVEDLDRARVRAGSLEGILDDLAWLGLDWDEGPHEQGKRLAVYEAAFTRLLEAGKVYPCFCSRKDVATAASAPQARQASRERRHAWRFRVEETDRPTFVDLVRGPWSGEIPTDFVVKRADGVPAYQLAVVVDDAAMEITEVVRGDDLLASTARQILLYHALGVEPPRFGHVPLLLGPDGVRLSKRHAGSSIRDLRAADLSPEDVIGRLAHLLGITPDAGPRRARDLIAGFSLDRIARSPEGIVTDPGDWTR
jgi:glutamyl-tRNA synthetase